MSVQFTRIIRIDADRPEDALLLPAALALRQGELVAFPTETVYGLGANALDPIAVARIFQVKGRPGDNPLIIHIASLQDLPPLVKEITPLAAKLLQAFAPGPLTLILPKSSLVPDLVTAGLATVAIRIPAHPVARRLIELAGVPVAAPSANRSGRPSPTRAWHVAADLDGQIPWIIEAGDSQFGLESTVVDATGTVPVILRPGAITAAEIRKIAGAVRGTEPVRLANAAPPRSPGMKYRHYAPRAAVVIAEAENPESRFRQAAGLISASLAGGLKVGVFICRMARPFLPGPIQEIIPAKHGLSVQPADWETTAADSKIIGVFYGTHPDARLAGAALFDALRRLDEAGADTIIAEGLPDAGIGAAYMNRLRKAAGSEPASLPQPKSGRSQMEPAAESRLLLFVCTGNTCRSPMAAALFNDLKPPAGWHAGSAGMSALTGEPASLLAETAMQLDYSLDLTGHRSRPVTPELLDQADLVLTMTRSQRDALRLAFPEFSGKIRTVGELAGSPDLSIPDPIGHDLAVYQETAAVLADLVEKIKACLP